MRATEPFWTNTTASSEQDAESNMAQMHIGAVFKTVLLSVIAIANLVGNSCVCLVVLKDEPLRNAPRNATVASLAISDLLMLQVIFFRILTYYGVGNDCAVACDVLAKVFPILVYVSFLHLAVMSVDRYLAILYPLKYRFLVTHKRVAIALATAWTLPTFSIGLVPLFLSNTHGFTFRATFFGCIDIDELEPNAGFLAHMSVDAILFFAIPVLFMFVSYARISKAAWKQAVRVHSLEFGGNLQRDVRPRTREMKWAKTVGIVIGAFVLCYLPLIVLSLIRARISPSPTIEEALEGLSFITYTNSVLNPVVYSLKSYEYRKAFKKICSGRPSQPQHNIQLREELGERREISQSTSTTET